MVREDSKIKKTRELLYQEKEKSANFRKQINGLEYQYKMILKSYRKQVEWFRKNAWKATFVSIYLKLRKVVNK